MTISKLKQIPIRNVWKNEEKDFTPWLQENIEILTETLNMELSPVGKEVKVGDAFEADLLAEGPDGDLVVIENQFDKSDHDHLGKILTYLVNLEAKKAIWICENPQPEHLEAIDWLNKTSPPDIAFYLVKLEAFQIENSPPAPRLSIVAQPSRQIKEAGGVREELAERHIKRLEFWKQLLEYNKKMRTSFSNISPSKENWISAGAGTSGVLYQYVINMNEARIQLAMEGADANKNKRTFDALYQEKESVEKEFGEEFTWRRLDDRKSSYISKTVADKGLEDADDWPKIIENMTDCMIRFEKVMGKRIRQVS